MNNFTIQTKSFLEPKKRSDGLRISVMRRHKPEYDFDIWFPKLAPSEQLLKKYVKEKTIGWRVFSKEYKTKILTKNKKYIALLVKISKHTNISLMCWERDEKHCHRLLIKEACDIYRKSL
jgi:uncharacterized protein YeaO (DUF488 family)